MRTPEPTTPSRNYSPNVSLWLTGVTTFLVAVAFELEYIRLREFMIIACSVFGVAAAYAITARPTPRQIAAIVLCIALTMLVQVLPELIPVGAHRYFNTGSHIAYVLLGWAFVFIILGIRGPQAGPITIQRPGVVAGACIVTAFAVLALVHWTIRRDSASVVDEVLYLFQSENIRKGALAHPFDPSLSPFFSIRQTFVNSEHLNGQYPPGWPAILAVFRSLGFRWWAPTVFGGACLWITYALGTRAHSKSAGVIATALLATSYWFLFLSSTYYSMIPSITLCATGALLLVSAESAKRPMVLRALAGLAFGGVLTMRPLTAVAMGAAVLAWTTLRTRPAFSAFVRSVAVIAAGAALPIALMLAYNASTTGDVLTFGYDAAHGSLQKLGFGIRGQIVFAGTGAPTPDATYFGWYAALAAFASEVRNSASEFVPACVFVGLLLVAWLRGVVVDIRHVVAFAMLPLAQIAHCYSNPRFYAELLPFIAMGTAIVLIELARKDGRAARAMLVFLLAGNVFVSVKGLSADRNAFHKQFAPSLDAVAQLGREHEQVLVFVNDGPVLEVLYEALWLFNVDGIPGRIAIARDLGARNQELMARLPSHYAVRLKGFGNWTPTFERIGLTGSN